MGLRRFEAADLGGPNFRQARLLPLAADWAASNFLQAPLAAELGGPVG